MSFVEGPHRYTNLRFEQQHSPDLDPQSVQVKISMEVEREFIHRDGTLINVGSIPVQTQQASCSFYLPDFQKKPVRVYTTLSNTLTSLQVFDQECFDQLIREIFSVINKHISNMGLSGFSLCVSITKVQSVYVMNCDMRLVNMNSRELEIRNNGDGRIPASESSMKMLLERVKMKGENHSGCQSQSCTICLEELAIGSYATRMPCLHLFHGHCIVKWLKESRSCPVCRFEVPPK